MPRALKNINLEVGARIKRQRLAQKLTREQLASLSGYSANFIQEVERGRSGLSSESIRAFSVALKISCDYLLFGDMSEGYGYLLSKLDAIPQAKRKYVIEIIEAAIQCANTQE
ncbi:helix-turn-helix transcriptional regulator [Flintibacter sp. HCN-6482]|uniref:helix-turn-helix domain-containing protein n=1 Tax=Flintibacter sp. HCN-6482 TaxID=3134672 RepID=UPI0030BDC927